MGIWELKNVIFLLFIFFIKQNLLIIYGFMFCYKLMSAADVCHLALALDAAEDVRASVARVPQAVTFNRIEAARVNLLISN
jgi:hypothetical protein